MNDLLTDPDTSCQPVIRSPNRSLELTPSAAMASARLGGGGGEKAAADMPALSRPKPNLADYIFNFCMKASIVLAVFYFALLVYIAISEPQFGKLKLLPFFGVAVIVPFYAAALLQEHGT